MFGALVLLCLGLWRCPTPTSSAQSNVDQHPRQISMLGIFAIGIAFVIVTGGIDLSVGSVIGLTGVIIAKISGSTIPTIPRRAASATRCGSASRSRSAVAALIGLAQGLLITRLQLQPFIVTLGGHAAAARRLADHRRGRHSEPRRTSPLAGLSNGGLFRSDGEPDPALSVPDLPGRGRGRGLPPALHACSGVTSTPSAATARRPTSPASTCGASRP